MSAPQGPAPRVSGHPAQPFATDAPADGAAPIPWKAAVPGLVVALAIRLVAFAVTNPIKPEGDEKSYRFVATMLTQGKGIVEAGEVLRVPGYAIFLASHALVGLDFNSAAKITQALLSVATQVIFFFILFRIHGRRVALHATWIFALYPELVGYAQVLRPETLYLFLLTAGTAQVLACRRDAAATGAWRRRAGPLLAGATFGLACLVRPMAFYFLAFVAVWLVVTSGQRRRVALSAALVIAGALVPILPWTVRNALRFHRFVLLDANVGYNLAIGNNEYLPTNWEVGRGARVSYALCDEPNLVDRDRCNSARALSFIRTHPTLFMRRVGIKMKDLWRPATPIGDRARPLLSRHLAQPLPDAVVRSFALLYQAVLCSAILGLALPARAGQNGDSERAAFAAFVLGLLVYTVALHALFVGQSRYRFPVVPFLFPFAALPFSGRLPDLLRRPARLVLAVAGLLLLAWLWS